MHYKMEFAFWQLAMSSKIWAVHLERLMSKTSFARVKWKWSGIFAWILHCAWTYRHGYWQASRWATVVLYGFAIPVLRQTEASLNRIQYQLLKYKVPLVQNALRGMQKRFQLYLQQDLMVVKDSLLATVSHPSYMLKPILKERRGKLKQELIDIANKLSSNVSEVFYCNKSRDTYFQWSDDEEETPQTQKNLTSIEVLQYLEDPNTNLESLHRYPKIKNVFLKFNTSLTSSAPVERLFSFASIILQERWGRLTDKNFEKLTLLKANKCKAADIQLCISG